jgi:membrane associated rhomboid family serine protease
MWGSYRYEKRPVTLGIVLVCTGIFLIQYLAGVKANNWLISVFGLSRSGIESGFYWEFVSHMFLHGNFFHLLVNMLALWFAGREMERILGAWRFLALFLLGGIVGGILQIAVFPQGSLIGASGGVCAVLLAFTTSFPELPITALLFFILPLRLKAKYLGWGIMGISILFLALNIEPQIGHLAHLGGCLTGMAYAKLYAARFPWIGTRVSLPKVTPAPSWFGKWVNPTQQEVDRILAKVIRDGLHSLTPSERSTLETWTSRRG